MIRAVLPRGGALEPANIKVSVATFPRAPSGKETVTQDSDQLVLGVAEYVLAKRMLVQLGAALRSLLCGMCTLCEYEIYTCAY